MTPVSRTHTLIRILLVGFLLLLVSLIAIGYTSYTLYKKVLANEENQRIILAEQERLALEQKEASNALLTQQESELLAAKSELEKTKTEAAKTSAQIKSLSEVVDKSASDKQIVISSSDIGLYSSGVVQVICVQGQSVISGSGSLFSFKETSHAVLTNYHVVENADRCVAVMTNTANTITGVFALREAIYTYNKNTDQAILALGDPLSKNSVPVGNYNYSLSSLKKCTSLLPIGSPVVIVGFPAYAKRDSTVTIDTIGTVQSIYRTTTNGIISGYDTSGTGDANYFVSAKIDKGNSGGIALAKDASGLCALGLPTWLTVGNYETQGLVQNINAILPGAQ
ncbi:MAG: Trypsin-like peptidase domain [Candidatus Parcubacteria bacterium]|jgi:S1-C subfamily serine protease